MLLKDDAKKISPFLKYTAYILGVLVLFAGLFLLLRSLVPIYNDLPKGLIKCDAENVQGRSFVTGRYLFNNGITRSREQAFKGQYSSKTTATQKRGFLYKLRNPRPGERYKVQVWRYQKTGEGGALRVSSDLKSFTKTTAQSIQRKNNWDLLELVFNVPFNKNLEYLLFYVAATDNVSTVYFDDLTIEKLRTPAINPRAFSPRPLNLRLTEIATQQLKEQQENALANGLLESNPSSWVVGQLKEGERRVDIKLRLKGNRIDHLKNKKWSLKVDVNKKAAWNNMTNFSLQNPSLRNFLNEWLFHQLLKKEGIITADYDFVELTLNNDYLGVYAFEEGFEQHLIEKNERPNGPIVRFSEEAYWQNFKRQRQQNDSENKNTQFINNIDAAKAEPYKRRQVQNTPLLKEQNELALKLMNAFKYGKKQVPEVFDIDLLAKYFAIVDLMQAYRGIQWHNLRFYYNPVSSKLEPIGYDGFGSGINQPWHNGKFIGYKSFTGKKAVGLIDYIFQDKTFLKQYLNTLYKYSSRKFIGQFMVDIEQDLLKRERFIQREFKQYIFNSQAIVDRANELQGYLTPFNNSSVQAYLVSTDLATKLIKVTNYHNVPLELVGFGAEATEIASSLSPSLLLKTNQDNVEPKFVQIKAGRDIQFAFYKLTGLDSTFVTPVEPWSPPQNYTPEQALFSKPTLVSNDIFTVKDKTIQFKIGKHQVNFDIVISEGYQVIIKAGTQLDFVENAKFISKSPVFMNGTQRNPIQIISSDETANGFTIIKAPKPSALKYVQFKNLKKLDFEGWQINSSLTFYESAVTLDHCQFEDCESESVLQIYRSPVKLLDISVLNAPFNGIKLDYCTGEITNATIKNTGGNGIDVLGGNIQIANTVLEEVKDKAISVGNNGMATINTTTIDNTNIALASKDLSTIQVDFINIKNCQHGFTAFQKKPEYGGGKILVKDYDSYNIRYLHLIEKGSLLDLKGTEITEF